MKKIMTQEELVKKYLPVLKVMIGLTAAIAVFIVLLCITQIQLIDTFSGETADTMKENAVYTLRETATGLFGNIGYFTVAVTSIIMFVFTIKDGTPFTVRTSTTLFVIAAEVMITAIASPFLGRALTTHMIGGSYPVANSSGDIFCASLLFVISTFFRYGTRLQQESDETL